MNVEKNNEIKGPDNSTGLIRSSIFLVCYNFYQELVDDWTRGNDSVLPHFHFLKDIDP